MSRLAVVDRDGWRKEFPLAKPIVFVGSDPGDDIILEAGRGGGVAPRHAQLLLQAGAQNARVVTFGGPVTIASSAGSQQVAAYNAAPIGNGDTIKIGDFTLIYLAESAAPAAAPRLATPAAAVVAPVVSAPVSSPVTASAPPLAVAAAPVALGASPVTAGETGTGSIGVRVMLPPTPLAPDGVLEGTITVRNQGNRPGAQFRLQVEGLEPDSYEIGPGPILFPNAEKDVVIRVTHPRRPRPPAGELQLVIRASAPEAYPREEAVAVQTITVMPFYNHTLRLVTTA